MTKMEFLIEMTKWTHDEITNYILSNGKGPKMSCPITRLNPEEINNLTTHNINISK